MCWGTQGHPRPGQDASAQAGRFHKRLRAVGQDVQPSGEGALPSQTPLGRPSRGGRRSWRDPQTRAGCAGPGGGPAAGAREGTGRPGAARGPSPAPRSPVAPPPARLGPKSTRRRQRDGGVPAPRPGAHAGPPCLARPPWPCTRVPASRRAAAAEAPAAAPAPAAAAAPGEPGMTGMSPRPEGARRRGRGRGQSRRNPGHPWGSPHRPKWISAQAPLLGGSARPGFGPRADQAGDR